MSTILNEIVFRWLPAKRKQNTKGWIIFNSVCCHHRGHNPDTRSRGNLLITADGHMVVNCYNCGFQAAFKGTDMSANFETWLKYLGTPQVDIQRVKLALLNDKLNGPANNTSHNDFQKMEVQFNECELPENSIPIVIAEDINQHADLLSCMTYLKNRGRAIAYGYNYYWCNTARWQLNKRVIIPFYHNNKIVGWTARYVGQPPKSIPKYYNSNIQPGYIFNNKVLNIYTRKFILIAEGPMDAIAIDGVSPLGSTMSKQQISWLNSIDKEKIIVPDRQLKNQDLIDVALDNNWQVSFPPWNEGIKDAADASIHYGKLYTIASILNSRTSSRLEIGVKRQMLRS